jgi:hypothetical protein
MLKDYRRRITITSISAQQLVQHTPERYRILIHVSRPDQVEQGTPLLIFEFEL